MRGSGTPGEIARATITRVTYLSVFVDSCAFRGHGEMHAIINVLFRPPSESFNNIVSTESRYLEERDACANQTVALLQHQ
jgi:hypothetical protein